jgi:SAM-dependent methyltransferase
MGATSREAKRSGGRLIDGRHPDPLIHPRPEIWSRLWRDALGSSSHSAFAAGLRADERDARASLLADLGSYFGTTADETLDLCRNWKRHCSAEWEAAEVAGPDGVREFHRTTTASSYSLLWYAYLQAEGHAYPSSAIVGVHAPQADGTRRMRHLDFGSGVGATSAMFAALGFEVDLADVSTSMLGFAQHRLERRGVEARYIDLNCDRLDAGHYDIVTAIDVLAHVPDFDDVAAGLFRTLRPGGMLYCNFDVRHDDSEPWHLYDNDLPLRRALQAAGFEQVGKFDQIFAYRRVERSYAGAIAQRIRDAVQFGPVRHAYRVARWKLQHRQGDAEARS